MRPLIPVLLLVSAAALSAPAAPAAASPDLNAIVQRWTAALRHEVDAAPQYSYTERVRDDDGDKTYEVRLLYGSPYKRLVAINDAPLDQSDEQTQQERFADAQSERARESPADRARRLADYRKDFERGHRILEELPRAFRFSLRGSVRAGSRRQYILDASPRAGYDPPTTEADVLTGMRGTFWIDAETYQLSRATARVLQPVRIDGFLATIQPGTEFVVEQQAIGDDLWLPTRFQIRSHSSILFVFHHHLDEDRRFSGYHREPPPAPLTSATR